MTAHTRGAAKGPPLITPIVVQDTKKVVVLGSSTSAGGTNQQQNGIVTTPFWSWLSLRNRSPVSAKAFVNYSAGGATETGVASQADTAVAAGNDNENLIVQCDLNTTWRTAGGGDNRKAWLKSTLLPKFNALVLSEKRWCGWVGTEELDGLGGVGPHNSARFERLAFAEWPGRVVNELRYWGFVKPGPSEGDFTDHGGQLGGIGRWPRSAQVADRSHPNDIGQLKKCELWASDLYEAWFGGLPFFPDHRYYVNNDTARTNGGAVCTLGFVGDLTGVTLALQTVTGAISTEFAIDSAAAVTKIGAGGLMQPRDLFVRVQKGDRAKFYHIEIALPLAGTVPQMCRLDGHFGLSLFSNDNAGDETTPNYSTSAAYAFPSAVLGTNQQEGTFVACIQPDADVDSATCILTTSGAIAAQPAIATFQRLTTGAFRATLADDSGNTFGQQTSTGLARNGNGRRWVSHAWSVAANTQEIVVYDDATGQVASSAATNITARSNGALNVLTLSGSNQRMVYMFGGSTNAYSNYFKGLVGPIFQFNKKIDLTGSVGSNPANWALFRAGAGSFVDVGADGTVTPSTGSNSGTPLSPYNYFRGDACELVDGRNRGTCGLWEPWQRRDPFGQNWAQGVPVTQ